jgi:hypothetical protein
MLAGTMENHPLGKPLKRTANGFLRELEQKILAGEIPAEQIRGKVSEFATAISWINDAPMVIRGETGELTTASVLGDTAEGDS